MSVVTLGGALALLALTLNGAPVPDSPAARGAYLVKIMGCNDCHTPWKTGPKGPEPDMTRMLSGHPRDVVMPPAPSLGPGPWAWAGGATNTAFAGPWGVSFAANLTPDAKTGLGTWDEATFVEAIRSGRHEGKGRPILPPMPWPMYRNATDEDLRAVFAFLRTLSETGLTLPGGEVDPRNLAFSPQYPLWTDGAAKSRWIRLPEGTKVDVSDVDAWRFPVGTKLWKEFAWGGRRVETRMIWKAGPETWVFATYVWPEDGPEAVLARRGPRLQRAPALRRPGPLRAPRRAAPPGRGDAGGPRRLAPPRAAAARPGGEPAPHPDERPDRARRARLPLGRLRGLPQREGAARALALEPDEPTVHYNVACFYANLGEVDRALDCLEKALAGGGGFRDWIRHDGDLDPHRDHPRFRALLAGE